MLKDAVVNLSTETIEDEPSRRLSCPRLVTNVRRCFITMFETTRNSKGPYTYHRAGTCASKIGRMRTWALCSQLKIRYAAGWLARLVAVIPIVKNTINRAAPV